MDKGLMNCKNSFSHASDSQKKKFTIIIKNSITSTYTFFCGNVFHEKIFVQLVNYREVS